MSLSQPNTAFQTSIEGQPVILNLPPFLKGPLNTGGLLFLHHHHPSCCPQSNNIPWGGHPPHRAPQGPLHIVPPTCSPSIFRDQPHPRAGTLRRSPLRGEGQEERRGEGSNSITPSPPSLCLPPPLTHWGGHGGHLGPCIGPAGGSVAIAG